MHDAIRIQVEAPGFARQFLAFYAPVPAEGGGQSIDPGKLCPSMRNHPFSMPDAASRYSAWRGQGARHTFSRFV